MGGKNVFVRRSQRGLFNWSIPRPTSATVFISHRSVDKPIARTLAREIERLNIDYWLDEEDEATQEAASADDAAAIAAAVEAGLVGSTHLLCLVTKNTQGSWWVPFEVGEARGLSKPFALLTHREVERLPEWASLGANLTTRGALRDWLSKLASHPQTNTEVGPALRDWFYQLHSDNDALKGILLP
jgi:hypothetical protein